MNKIYVVTHKNFTQKLPDNYQPIQVGKMFTHNDLGYISDDTGDNIAEKNKNYCELTALYWIWKNDIKSDIVGLCHYRRYFTKNEIINSPKFFLNDKDIDKILGKYDIIVPKKLYWGNSTVRAHYSQYDGFDKDLITTGEVIKEICPDYFNEYDKIVNGKSAFYCNMFITKKEVLNDYCEWLFKVLKKVEEKTDISGYSVQEARIYGYISEILLDVWIEHNKLKYKEVPTIFTEGSIQWRALQIVKNTINRLRG